MTEDLNQQRRDIINQVYDIILKPEQTNDFVGTWEAYITKLSSQFDDRQNATGPAEKIIADDGLETHFARAYAILERVGRNQENDRQTEDQAQAGLWVRFNLDGDVLHQSHQLAPPISHATEIAAHLTSDAATDWHDYLAQTQRAPAVAKLRVFSQSSGGNLIAYNHRDEATGEIEIIVRDLLVTVSPKVSQLLTEQFGLTKGELQLVALLAEHGSLDRIVKQSNRSKNTLRTQMKAVFTKMNVASQPAVLQSVAMLAHFCATLGYEGPTGRRDVVLGKMIEVMSGDTAVPVHMFGPDDGHPVLFIHGMLDGVALNPRTVKALHRHNLRFISPVRPNYGAAAPHPEIQDAPTLVTQQLCDVAEALDLQDALMLGHMSGGLFAFAASPALHNRVAGIVNISCGVPILSTRQFSHLSKRQKAFAYTTRYAPAILPTLLRLGVAQIDSIEIETMMDDMYRPESPDRDLLMARPDVAAVVLDGYRFAVAQGYKGFQGDALQVTRNWSSYADHCKCPVLLIQGHHDPAVDFTTVKPFADRYGFELCDYPDDGQLLLYGKPDSVLQRIAAFRDTIIGQN